MSECKIKVTLNAIRPEYELQSDQFLMDTSPFILKPEHIGKRPVLEVTYTKEQHRNDDA